MKLKRKDTKKRLDGWFREWRDFLEILLISSVCVQLVKFETNEKIIVIIATLSKIAVF